MQRREEEIRDRNNMQREDTILSGFYTEAEIQLKNIRRPKYPRAQIKYSLPRPPERVSCVVTFSSMQLAPERG